MGTEFTPRDLLHSALMAILEDRRSWRQDLPLVVYVTGLMRSIASAFRKSVREEPCDDLPDEGIYYIQKSAVDGNDPLYWVLADEDAGIFLNALMDHFADDLQVRTVIKGRMFGESAFCISSLLGVNETQYETICRRLTRGYRQMQESFHHEE